MPLDPSCTLLAERLGELLGDEQSGQMEAVGYSLYMEMLDRAVVDNQGLEIGTITELVKVKRTYRGVLVHVRSGIQRRFGVEPELKIPITAFSRTRETLDEVILSRNFDRVLTLPSYITINDPNYGLDE